MILFSKQLLHIFKLPCRFRKLIDNEHTDRQTGQAKLRGCILVVDLQDNPKEN